MGVYASFSFRVLANAEAMNAVESLGNIIRHRKATVIVSRGNGHQVITVPVVSGEAIRHGYQLELAKLAKVRGIKVCKLCEQGEFVKHGIEDLISKLEPDLYKILSSDNVSLRDKEYAIIESCAVEDIAGFLVPMENVQIKRTSKVEVSYMIPAIGDLKYGLDTQFHVRHAPQAQQALGQQGQAAQPQSIYYIESASAIYTFTVNIDLTGIGQVSNCIYREGNDIKIDCNKALDPRERVRRVELALDALAELVKSGPIGGHHSSYSPHWIPGSAVALITRPIPTVAYPGHYTDFITKTRELAEGNRALLGGNYTYELVAFKDDKVDPGVDVQGISVVKGSIPEFFRAVKEVALKWVGEEFGVK